MKYVPDCMLHFLIENYMRAVFLNLNSAQLRGLFKDESYCLGQLDILEKLSTDLNLKIDVDKLKL